MIVGECEYPGRLEKRLMVTPPEGFDITDSDDPQDQVTRTVLKRLMRRVVCLGFLVRARSMKDTPAKDALIHFRSGFVMEVRDRWYWATAGHVLEEIQQDGFGNPNQIAEEFRLIDSFGEGAVDQHYVPFDFERA
jgi:hypothetical protein